MISFITILVIIYNYIDINITYLVGTIGLFGVSAFRLAPIVSQFVVTNNSIRFNRECLTRLTNDLGTIGFNNNIYQSKGSNILSNDSNIFKSIKLTNCYFSYKGTTHEILKKSYEIIRKHMKSMQSHEILRKLMKSRKSMK